jgi:pimeloyl-ACP methyl ester carboxylesterase
MILAVAVCAVTGCSSAPSPIPDDKEGPLESFFEVSEGVKLAVLDWGGSGPPLILLSGATRTGYVWEDVAPYFVDRRTVIGLTRRRVGRSSVPAGEFGLAELVSDIVALLDARGIQQADFIGHSFGGAELSYLALHHPERVRRAVFLDGGWDFYDMYNADGWWNEWPQRPMAEADSASPEAVAAYFARTAGVLLPISEIRAAHQFDEDGRLVQLDPHVGDMFPGMIRARLTPLDMAGINVPVLSVRALPEHIEEFFFPEFTAYSDDDQRRAVEAYERWIEVVVAGGARFAATVPGAEQLVLSGAHHDLPNVGPERFVPTVREFLLR